MGKYGIEKGKEGRANGVVWPFRTDRTSLSAFQHGSHVLRCGEKEGMRKGRIKKEGEEKTA